MVRKGVEAGPNKRGLKPEGNRATKIGMNKSNILRVPAPTLEGRVIYVGLDVHKETIAIGMAKEGLEAEYYKTISHDLHAVEKLIQDLREGGRCVLKVCYEAGPTGFVLARRLAAWGIECVVVSPSRISKEGDGKVKTDRRDAVKLARLLRAGELQGIHVPEAGDEAVRDLCRARTDAVEDLRRLRQQLKGFLLRQGYRYKGKSSWTPAHERYLRELVMDHAAHKVILEDTLQAIGMAQGRIGHLEEQMEALLSTWRLRPVVEALMCMKGFKLVGAMVLASELGDLRRFEQPRQLMAYLGLVSSEHSSGNKRRQGGITKCGNGHARLFLVEAAHHYRTPPKVSKELSRRQEGQSRRICRMSWEAQNRLHKKMWRLLQRGLPAPKAVVACARELSGFIWAVSREALEPGSVEIRSPRVVNTPNGAARQVEYVLKRSQG